MRFTLRAVAWAVGLCAALAAGAVRADQSDPRLDQLFADLRAADSQIEGRAIEAQIWAIWTRSGDPAVDALMDKGVAQLGAGDTEAALATFDQMVKLAPGFSEGWNKRATTLYLLGRFAESVADIQRVIALEPRHFGALSGLGMCDVALHQTKAALDALLRAQAIDPLLSGIAENIALLKRQLARESI